MIKTTFSEKICLECGCTIHPNALAQIIPDESRPTGEFVVCMKCNNEVEDGWKAQQQSMKDYPEEWGTCVRGLDREKCPCGRPLTLFFDPFANLCSGCNLLPNWCNCSPYTGVPLSIPEGRVEDVRFTPRFDHEITPPIVTQRATAMNLTMAMDDATRKMIDGIQVKVPVELKGDGTFYQALGMMKDQGWQIYSEQMEINHRTEIEDGKITMDVTLRWWFAQYDKPKTTEEWQAALLENWRSLTRGL